MVNKKKIRKEKRGKPTRIVVERAILEVRAWRTLSAKSMRKQSRKILLKSWQKRFNFWGGHAIIKREVLPAAHTSGRFAGKC